MAQTKSKNQSAFISILRPADGRRTGKTYKAGRKLNPYPATTFTRELVDVTDFTPGALAGLIARLSRDPQASIVLGELNLPPEGTLAKPGDKKPVPPGQYLRRKVYLSDPNPWVRVGMVDFDNRIYMDDPTDPDEAMERLCEAVPALGTARCTLQFSSSAGLPEPDGRYLLKCHVWVVLDRPVRLSAWKNWLVLISDQANIIKLPKEDRPPLVVDPKLGSPVQVHYTADPKFIKMADPFGGDLRVHEFDDEDDVLLSAELIESAPGPQRHGAAKYQLIDPATPAMIRGNPIAQHMAATQRLLALGPTAWRPMVCLWVDEHTDSISTGTAMLVLADGSVRFNCMHASCEHRKHSDWIEKIIEEGGKPFMTSRVAPEVMHMRDTVLADKVEAARVKAEAGATLGARDVSAVVRLCRILMQLPTTELADLETYLAISPEARELITYQFNTREATITPHLDIPGAVRTPSLQDIDVMEESVQMVHWGTGTGKTKGSKAAPGVILRAIESAEFALTITPRIALTNAAALDFGMHHYDDIKDGIVKPGLRGLAVTLPSITHQDIANFIEPDGKLLVDVLVIDEPHTLLNMLASKKIMEVQRPAGTLQMMKRLLSAVPTVILADADASPADIQALRELSGRDITVHTMPEELGRHPDGSERSMRIVSWAQAEAAMRDGTVRVVLCDGVGFLHNLHNELIADGVKVSVIYSGKSKKDKADLIGAIERGLRDGGMVLLSPACDTGISILEPLDGLSRPGAVLNIITHNNLTPQSRRQFIMRVRAATEILVTLPMPKQSGRPPKGATPKAAEIIEHATQATQRAATEWDHFAATRIHAENIDRAAGIGGFLRFMYLRGVAVAFDRESMTAVAIKQYLDKIRNASGNRYQDIVEVDPWTHADGTRLSMKECYARRSDETWQIEIERAECVELIGRDPRDAWEVQQCISPTYRARVMLRLRMLGQLPVLFDEPEEAMLGDNQRRRVDAAKALLAHLEGGPLPDLAPLLTASQVKDGDDLIGKALRSFGYVMATINGTRQLADSFVRKKEGNKWVPGRLPVGSDKGVDLLDTLRADVKAERDLRRAVRKAVPSSAYRKDARLLWLSIIDTCTSHRWVGDGDDKQARTLRVQLPGINKRIAKLGLYLETPDEGHSFNQRKPYGHGKRAVSAEVRYPGKNVSKKPIVVGEPKSTTPQTGLNRDKVVL